MPRSSMDSMTIGSNFTAVESPMGFIMWILLQCCISVATGRRSCKTSFSQSKCHKTLLVPYGQSPLLHQML
ncbi:hypothetical protein VN97_g4046 [Penicillium thymicola]|uniref:Uncharacterized protein n=1 Tax=Penicillium thymicola TaxID=293382 RepID=A0AAI9TKZ1_PENTH|nr:hypothetical protein VN97_g4046 [Penicillium thymicola]